MNTDQQRVILNRIEAVLARPAGQARHAILEDLLLLRAISEYQPEFAPQIYQQLWPSGEANVGLNKEGTLPLGQGIILAELARSTYADWHPQDVLAEALQIRNQLKTLIDPLERGVISLPPGHEQSNDLLSLQTLWVKNTESFEQLALAAGANADDIGLELSVLIYETNQQFWSTTAGLYRSSPNSPKENPDSISAYLPLWAQIPDQDQAEEMLIQLRAHASPWVNPTSVNWVTAASVFICQGLKEYEMHKAAQEMKDYLLHHCQNTKDNWLYTCISLAFAASSPD